MTNDNEKPAKKKSGPAAGSSSAPDGRILVGRFGAPHGVRGEVRIKSFTAEPLAISRYGELSNLAGSWHFQIRNARHIKDDMLVARISGVETRDAAEALTNQDIFIARDQLPPADDDEFYLADLIGLEARLQSGERFGRVLNVANFGAGDILEIDVGAAESKLLPFTKTAVPAVRVADGYVLVEPPAEIDGESAAD